MIEIILREDVSSYETKPLFGFSYRQVGAVAAAAVIAVVLWNILTPAGVSVEITGLLILLLGAIAAACFLVKIQGMYGTKRLPILLNYYLRPKTVFAQNCVFRGQKREKEMSKKEKADKKREQTKAKHETEFCGTEGECVSAKKRIKLVEGGKIKSNKRRLTLNEVIDKALIDD